VAVAVPDRNQWCGPGHHGLGGTPAHGFGMVGRLRGSGLSTTVPFGVGYLAPAGHGARPASHSTCGNRSPPGLPAAVVPPQRRCVFARLAGALPSGARLPAKQFCGSPPNSVICPKSELLGLRKEPLCLNVLWSS